MATTPYDMNPIAAGYTQTPQQQQQYQVPAQQPIVKNPVQGVSQMVNALMGGFNQYQNDNPVNKSLPPPVSLAPPTQKPSPFPTFGALGNNMPSGDIQQAPDPTMAIFGNNNPIY